MVKFTHIEYLWIFAVVVLFITVLVYSRIQRKKSLKIFAGEHLGHRLLDDFQPQLRRLREYILIVSLLFVSLAILGPQVGMKLREVKRKGVNIIIALDTSLSMKVEDIKPNRLERAKYEIGKFIDRLKGDRVGLVAFAGISYLQCPLTLDYSAAKLFLDVMDSGIIGTQGTALADAVNTSLKAFKSEEKKHKVILIISDGEDHEGSLDQISQIVNEQGVIIYTVGIGTYYGAPIPVFNNKTRSSEFKKDRSGRIITSSLQEESLRNLALISGGKYYNLASGGDVFSKIYREILGMEKTELKSHEYSDYRERYQIFLVIGLILIVLEIFIPEKIHRKKEWMGRFE